MAALRDLGAFPDELDVQHVIDVLGLDRPPVDPTTLTADELVAEMQHSIKTLLGIGARMPKELMLFVKNLMFLDGAIATLAPDLDLFAEVEAIALLFAAKHGERIMAQLGLEHADDWAPDMAGIKAGFGLDESTERLTHREIQARRAQVREKFDGRGPPARRARPVAAATGTDCRRRDRSAGRQVAGMADPRSRTRSPTTTAGAAGPTTPEACTSRASGTASSAAARFLPDAAFAAGPLHVLNGGIIATLLDCHGVCAAIARAYDDERRAIGSEPEIWYATSSMTVQYAPSRPPSARRSSSPDGCSTVEGQSTAVACVLVVRGQGAGPGDRSDRRPGPRDRGGTEHAEPSRPAGAADRPAERPRMRS